MNLTASPALRWEPDDPSGWYIAEQGGCTASLDMNKCRVFVHMSEATSADLAAVSALMGSMGLSFPASDLELAYGVMSGDCGSFTAGAEDGVWVLTADF